MDGDRLRQILEVLDAMIRTEDLMALFYTACSEAWPEHSALWMALAVEEENHGRIVARLRGILSANPDQFEPGQTVESSAVESCNVGISEMAEDIRRGSVPLAEALHFAEGMESSLTESGFLSLLKSRSRVYEELQGVVLKETAVHRDKIREVFRQIGGGG